MNPPQDSATLWPVIITPRRVLFAPEADAAPGGGATSVLQDPGQVDPMPGAGYTAVRLRNGKWAIRDVAIFLEMPKGERGNEKDIGKDWMFAAKAESERREREDKYLAPVHINHHGWIVDEALGAGQMRITDVRQIDYRGKKTWATFADILNLKSEAYAKVKAEELPYRSVEIHDWEKPEINSLALMEHHVPFYRLAMLTIGKEVDASETIDGVRLSAQAQKSWAQRIKMVAQDAARGVICLAALGHPRGSVVLQKLEGFGKVKDEKDEENGKEDPAEKYTGEDDQGEGERDENTEACCPCCEETNEIVKSIESMMKGELEPDDDKKPVDQPKPETEEEESSYMSAELLKELAELKKSMAALSLSQRRSDLKLSLASRLAGRKVPTALQAKIDVLLADEDVAAAEVRIGAMLDGLLSGDEAPAVPAKPPVPEADASGDPEPDLETFDANAPRKAAKTMPKEVLEFQAKGPKEFARACDLYESFRAYKKSGGRGDLALFLNVNMNGLGAVVRTNGAEAPEDEDNEAPEETE